MLQNLTKHIPLTTIIVSYFFICGGLYLIGFWTTFNVDISNLVSVVDIPKSFIFPFVVSQGFFIINILINLLTPNNIREDYENQTNEVIKEQTLWKRVLNKLINIDLLILFTSALIFFFYYDYKQTPFFWFASCLGLASLLSWKYDRHPALKRIIPYYSLRMYIVYTAISVPLFSFAIGKGNSLNIFNNKEIKFIKIISDKTLTEISDKNILKFIGFLGDKLVVSSIDNKTIIFINQFSFDQVHIVNKK